MMKERNVRLKRELFLLVSILLVMSMFFTACVSYVPKEENTGTGTISSKEDDKPYVITILAPFFAQEPPKEEGNPVLEFVEKQTGVDLQITWAPSGELESKFSTMMAANNMCMIMTGGGIFQTSNFIRMCETGAIWDLTDIIKDFPFISENLMNPTIERVSLMNGRRYIIPFNIPDARIGLLYRADWVENLGFELPENPTAQDIYNLAKAFTENDPDGDNVKNTTGFNFTTGVYGLDTFMVAMGAPNKWGYRDGKVVPYFDTSEYMEGLKLLRDMYEKGYMNDDFATLSSGAKYNPILEERAGFMFTTANNVIYPGGKFDTLIATNPKARMDYKLLLKDTSGNIVINSNITGIDAGAICLTTAKVKTEKDVRRILQFFVDAHSGECAKAIDIGIKDIHYSVDSNGNITISEEQIQRRAADGSREIFNTIPNRIVSGNWGQPMSQNDIIRNEIANNQKYAVPDISLGILSVESLQLRKSLETIIEDANVKFIMGFIDEDGFKKAVQDWKEQGGQEIIDELTRNYKP